MRAWGSVALVALAALALLGAGGLIVSPPVEARVVDATGRPVAGATVSVASRITGSTDRTTTGIQGEFGLPRLPALPYIQPEVTVSAPGYLAFRGPAGATVVLHRRPLLLGRALDDVGAGVGGAVVTATVGGRQWQTMTDGGYFWLDGVLDAGRTAVVITAGRHDPYQGEVDLRPDHAYQLEGTLKRQLGTLLITSDPPGVAVTMDGGPLPDCPATPCSSTVLAGDHRLEVTSDDYIPWSTNLTVSEGSRLAVPAQLVRKTGRLEVDAPAGAHAVLAIDGRAVGGSSWSGLLPTGIHSISYSADDHWPAALTAQVAWDQAVTIAVPSAAVTRGDVAGFQAGMARYLGSLPGQYSAWVSPLAGGVPAAYQPDSVMEAASVIKLPVAIYIERQAQEGRLRLSDEVELESSDFMGGTGLLDGTAQPGDSHSYQELLALLIQQSDNTAWQALDRVLGAGAVDAYAASIGAPDCHQLDDGCTSAEAGAMLLRLAGGQLLDGAHTRELLGLLETTVFNDRINYYLSGYVIAHKVGMDGSVINDAGVVYGPQPFVVAMFTDADPATGVEAIRQVARLAARLYGD